MGKYKWDVNNVYNQLDRLELIIKKLQPIVDEVGEKAGKLRKAKGLPQYVTQRLDNFSSTNKVTVDRQLAGIRSVRSTLPEIERNSRHKLPRLRVGASYKVMLGGATLAHPNSSQYYYTDESKNLFLGDIIKYQGRYVLEGKRPGSQPEDIFEIDSFTGRFAPAKDGRANLQYLAKVKGGRNGA